MLMQNIFAMGLLAVLWAVVVFSLAFGDAGNAGFIGNLDYVFLKDVGIGRIAGRSSSRFLTIPFVLFCAYQMTFAIITPALITGATADRLKFAGYAMFIGLWLVLVYGPVAHMVFAGGWLADMGALDFAGGAVVHINAGAAALAVVLRDRASARAIPDEPMPPHNLPFTVLGTGILWFGWAGFNAGSALAADGIAAQALMNTHPGPGRRHARLAARREAQERPRHDARRRLRARWPAWSPSRRAPASSAAWPRSTSASSPAWSATWPSASRRRSRLDDSLDVIAVHLVGGLVGSILLGFFADPAINAVVDQPGPVHHRRRHRPAGRPGRGVRA